MESRAYKALEAHKDAPDRKANKEYATRKEFMAIRAVAAFKVLLVRKAIQARREYAEVKEAEVSKAFVDSRDLQVRKAIRDRREHVDTGAHMEVKDHQARKGQRDFRVYVVHRVAKAQWESKERLDDKDGEDLKAIEDFKA